MTALKPKTPEEILEALTRLSEAFLNYFHDRTDQRWEELCWASGVGMGTSVAARSEKGPDPHECVNLTLYAAQILSVKDLPGALDETEQAIKAACAVAPFTYADENKQLIHDLRLLEAAMPLWRLAQRLRDSE